MCCRISAAAVSAVKRQVAGDHLVQHDAQRVDIDLGVEILAAFALLGRHVKRRAEDR